MKILTVFVLGWAIVALTGAEDSLNDEAADAETELLEEEDQRENRNLVKRFLFCHSGWTKINGACFKYNPTPMTWAAAEKICQSLGGHLASVLSKEEHGEIQKLTAAFGYKEAWIGGSDAQETNVWLWSDGEKFVYTNWCKGQPNNLSGLQHCVKTNYSAFRCWDDVGCQTHLPSVCAIRGWGITG